MASVNLSGILKDSLDEIDVGAIIKFTHLTTTGEVINTTEQVLIVPPDGSYNIDVNYGLVRIDYTTKNTERYVATVTVNNETVATTLPELIGTVTPVTEESLLFMQALVADAQESATGASASATQAEVAATQATSAAATAAQDAGDALRGEFEGLADDAEDSAQRAEAAASLINETPVKNLGVGTSALSSNTIGSHNTATGASALSSNTEGSNNTSMGSSSMLENTIGSENAAFGFFSLFSNTTGSNNTATGASSLQSNTTGVSNASVGRASLSNNTTGSDNSALGVSAMIVNTTGSGNSAFGRAALFNNTTGSSNSALGREALFNNTTGNGNVAIAPLTSSGVYSPVFNPTTESNRICMGSTSVTNAYIQVPWSVVSDARDKTEFSEINLGLDFVNNLKPVSYKFRENRDSNETTGTTKYGFKAQEVLKLEGDNPVIIDNENPEKLRMIDTALIPVLVKSIQQLTEKINSQQEQINELKGD